MKATLIVVPPTLVGHIHTICTIHTIYTIHTIHTIHTIYTIHTTGRSVTTEYRLAEIQYRYYRKGRGSRKR